MIHNTTLVESNLVCLARFDHPRDEMHIDPPAEIAEIYSINFVESGHFDLQRDKQRWRITPAMVFLAWPGLEFCCHHTEEVPQDVGLGLNFTQTFVEDILRTLPVGTKLTNCIVPLTNRLAYLRHRLVTLTNEPTDQLAAESLAGEVFSIIATNRGTDSPKLFREAQLKWYAERVIAAQELMEKDFAAPHSLTSLASTANMSPFHFARVFQSLTGTPPHRYLLKQRLDQAAARLRDGVSVTETCFATGFLNLSYFIRLFHRTFGLSPSCFAHQAKLKTRV